jgi:DNA-binding GntR family transcriptional regulator
VSRAADTAYGIIREKILSGALPPLTHLKEEDLADLCGVSRTPIRDALRRLEADMLVRRTDTQRTYVLELSAAEVEDIFTLRALLEGHACARAARVITLEQVAVLRGYNDSIHAAIHRSAGLDVPAFVANNILFHDGILEVSASDPLTTMRKLLVKQQVLHRTARQYDKVGLQRSHQDHEELLLAFTARDGEWARSVMDSHIRHALYVTLSKPKPQKTKVAPVEARNRRKGGGSLRIA